MFWYGFDLILIWTYLSWDFMVILWSIIWTLWSTSLKSETNLAINFPLFETAREVYFEFSVNAEPGVVYVLFGATNS